MKERLNTTKALVKSILEQVPETRSSDMLLYLIVCNIKNSTALELPFGAVITNLDKYNLPPFESVRRSRQKIQEKCPHLAACPEVQIFRAKNEEVFRDFARG